MPTEAEVSFGRWTERLYRVDGYDIPDKHARVLAIFTRPADCYEILNKYARVLATFGRPADQNFWRRLKTPKENRDPSANRERWTWEFQALAWILHTKFND